MHISGLVGTLEQGRSKDHTELLLQRKKVGYLLDNRFLKRRPPHGEVASCERGVHSETGRERQAVVGDLGEAVSLVREVALNDGEDVGVRVVARRLVRMC